MDVGIAGYGWSQMVIMSPKVAENHQSESHDSYTSTPHWPQIKQHGNNSSPVTKYARDWCFKNNEFLQILHGP